jgi:DNA-binding MarR family transcriptional regulator
MTDPSSPAVSVSAPSPAAPRSSSGASPLFLREDEIRRGIELLYFGYSRLTNAVDAQLATSGLGRAHHRALYFVARQPGISVGELLRLLAITKQSLGRVLRELEQRDLIATMVGERDRRQRLLRLTDAGAALEKALFAQLRERLAAAYADAGQQSVSGFWRVLEGLVPEADRAMVFGLRDP